MNQHFLIIGQPIPITVLLCHHIIVMHRCGWHGVVERFKLIHGSIDLIGRFD